MKGDGWLHVLIYCLGFGLGLFSGFIIWGWKL